MTRLVLTGGRLIDGTGADPIEGAVVVIDDSRIRSVGTGPAPTGDSVLDLDGLTVLPGLIDAHSHFGLVAADAATPAALIAARIFRNCALALAAGFTTARDTGGIDGGVAQAVALGLVDGPRILPSGPIISRTGGHGDFHTGFAPLPHPAEVGLPGLTRPGAVCDGVDEVRRVVRTALRRGATQLKVCVTGGFADYRPGLEDVEFAVEELQAAVAEADDAGTYVTAHAHNSAGIRRGLEAGVACFEHGTFLDDVTAAAMAAAGAALVPTLAVIHLLTEPDVAAGLPDEIVARAHLFEESMGASLKLAHDAGVVVGSGSDITGVEQNRRGLELALRATYVGGMEAIAMATMGNARVLRREDELGSLEPGKIGDVIAVDFDPLTEPELWDDPGRVVLVVKDGVVQKDARG